MTHFSYSENKIVRLTHVLPYIKMFFNKIKKKFKFFKKL